MRVIGVATIGLVLPNEGIAKALFAKLFFEFGETHGVSSTWESTAAAIVFFLNSRLEHARDDTRHQTARNHSLRFHAKQVPRPGYDQGLTCG